MAEEVGSAPKPVSKLRVFKARSAPRQSSSIFCDKAFTVPSQVHLFPIPRNMEHPVSTDLTPLSLENSRSAIELRMHFKACPTYHLY